MATFESNFDYNVNMKNVITKVKDTLSSSFNYSWFDVGLSLSKIFC